MTTDRARLKDQSFMAMARAAAMLGTCSRLQVGAVIVTDGVVVSSGRNGAPMGLPHCSHDRDEKCKISEHAESNAVVFAGRPKALGGTLYVTHSPCFACSSSIINAGIVEVVYDLPYRLDDGIKRLEEAGIVVRALGASSE